MKKINITPDGIEEIDLTAEEISQRETDIANSEVEKNKQVQKEADAKSGNQKFLDMGLTQAEATALTGYTPEDEE